MMAKEARALRFLSDYGMLLVLILLCVLFSVLTLQEQNTTGETGARLLFEEISQEPQSKTDVLVITGTSSGESKFAQAMCDMLRQAGYLVLPIAGEPSQLREAIALLPVEQSIGLVITTDVSLPVARNLCLAPHLAEASIKTPPRRKWPTFLLADNLRNVANQITVIAIIAIGMSMVIITAGIDLSVGSLIALSAVVVAWVVGQMGGAGISTFGVAAAGLAALLVCAATGAFSGLMITAFRIPPFIATLAMMQVAAGIAYIISQGRPIYELPEGFVRLGRGTEPMFDIPIAVILMFVLYCIAWVVMERTILGRYIYAVGGNPEAARLSGIRVNLVLLFAYTVSGLLAGLGGIIMASQLKSGAPTYGLTYELYVIAAVVVGGTSLSGGEGKIFGTLIGAFIIGVIQNGMNLTNIETYTQKVVLGLVILAAVLFDRLKQRGMKRRIGFLRTAPREKIEVKST